MLLTTLDDVRILRIDQPQEVVIYAASFVGAYQTIWADPPYNERFYPSEAEAILRRYLSAPEHITLLAVRGTSQVVGFGMALPLSSQPAITRSLRGLLPPNHTFYLSELGILPSWRQRGIGMKLVDLRLDLINRQRFSHVALRTSSVRDHSYQMFLRRGFEDMGVYMEVQSRRTDGVVRTDRRVFLSKVLEQNRSSL